MKIAFVVRRFSFTDWGGTQQLVWRTALLFQKLGHTVDILCTSALSTPGTEVRDGVKIIRFNYFYPCFPLTKELKHNLDVKGGDPFSSEITNAIENGHYDIIQLHSMGYLASQALRMAQKHNIPIFVTLHKGQLDVQDIEKTAPHLSLNYARIWKFFTRMKNDVVPYCNGIICVSENEYIAQAKKYSMKRVIHLPNGVDVAQYSTHSDFPFRQKYGIASHRKLIVCLSRLDPEKNQMGLLQAFTPVARRHPEALLLLVPPLSLPQYEEKVRQYIQNEKLDKSVQILPPIPPDSEEIKACYQNACVVVLPSRHEAFGIVVLESWASRVPIIASNIGGPSKLIRHNETGILYTLDRELEEYLSDALNNENFGINWREEAFQNVKNEYDYGPIAQRYIQFYEDIKNAFHESKNDEYKYRGAL